MTETTNIIHQRGIPINFPYPSAYTAQEQLMSKVIASLNNKENALLESPTGSGKSLAILCSVLAWHKTKYSSQIIHNLPTKPTAENELKLKKRIIKPPKIIFTSRTHGQLQQLIAEYRRTNYFHHFQMNVLGSRKSLCINTKIQPLSDRNDQCKKALENHDCQYYRGYHYGQSFKNSTKFAHGKVFDIEDLLSEGRKISCCPYMGTRAILPESNLLFCPYNYILDPIIRDQMNIDIKNNIIIIDEAHNVEDVCRSSLTKSYTFEELKFSIDELNKLLEMTSLKMNNNNIWESISEIKELFNLIIIWMNDLKDTLTMNDYSQHNNVFPHPNSGKNKITDIMKNNWEYDTKKCIQYKNYAASIFKYFSDINKQNNENNNNGPLAMENNNNNNLLLKLNPKLGVIIEYFCIYLLPNALEFENDFNMALLPVLTYDKQLRKKVKKIHLHFWCLSPSVVFKPIADIVHSVILTSGTLSPLDAMAFELKCKFEQRLVADHVIEKGQVLVTAIERGIKGNIIKCNYQNIQNHQIQNDIGLSLLSLFENIPEGIVVFFPSYNTMQTLTEKWINNGTYSKMSDIKKLYQEPRGSDETATKQFMDAIETFGRDCGNIKYIQKYKRTNKYKQELKRKQREKEQKEPKKGPMTKYLKNYSFNSNENNNDENNNNLDDITSDFNDTDLNSFKSEKGSVFFGVCRGKISEGIDFSDGMSRAVILIGIPYPNQKDTQIFFKKKYNDQQAQKIKAKYFGQSHIKQPYILDGKAWYGLQAFRALNQALGRCIRHKYDYGAIIFLESRFYGNNNRYTNHLTKWIKPYMRNNINVTQSIKDLIKPYFTYMEKNPPRPNNPTMVKWTPPFEMPKNNNNKRFFTPSPANNNKMNKNVKGFMTAAASTQSPANNYKGLKNNNNRFSGFNTPIKSELKTPPNHISNNFKPNGTNNGSTNGFNFRNNNNNRKRKYNEMQNENENIMNKKQKCDININIKPNCIQCKECSAMICRGIFEQIEFDKGGGIMQGFIASKQPFPCDTANNCIWSSALGLTFMYKMCDGCNRSVGLHCVGAMNNKKLQYVGQILFIVGGVNLLTIR